MAVHAAGAIHAFGRITALVDASNDLVSMLDRVLALGAISWLALGPASGEQTVSVVTLELDNARLVLDLLVRNHELSVDAATT